MRAIVAIVVALVILGAVTASIPIHQVSAQANPNPNPNAVQHVCTNPNAAGHVTFCQYRP